MHILYENDNLIVVDKPAGISVHPGAGETKETLSEWFINAYPEVKKYSWPNDPGLPEFAKVGIVHRLDKDTSGIIVLAKNPETQRFLQDQFKSRETHKVYQALVLGKIEPKEGVIDAQIGRDPNNRLQQRVTPMVFSWTRGKTRTAITKYKIIKNLLLNPYHLSLLEVNPLTGRMHQIRVHLAYLGYPIIGDPVYNTKESRNVSKILGLNRQFLHCVELTIKLPNGEQKTFHSKLAIDLMLVLNNLSEK